MGREDGIRDIDDALGEIRKARVDDGKPNTEHAPIESAMVYRDRVKEAQKQLAEAAKDLDEKKTTRGRRRTAARRSTTSAAPRRRRARP